jgi:hypothetical protein
MRLLPSFFAWCFLPERGVVRLVVEVTSTDPEQADVKAVWFSHYECQTALPDADEQRRMDEVAADSLAAFCAHLRAGDSTEQAEARVEADSLRLADAARGRWEERLRHPEDVEPPAWA